MLEQDDNIGGQSDDKQLNKSVSSMFLSLPDFSKKKNKVNNALGCRYINNTDSKVILLYVNSIKNLIKIIQ